MNYIIDKFRASIDVERGIKTVSIYTNSKTLRCATMVTTGWFNLSNTEENAPKDVIVAMEAEMELVTKDEVKDPIAVHNFIGCYVNCFLFQPSDKYLLHIAG